MICLNKILSVEILFLVKSIIYFVRIVKCPTFAPALQEKQG